MDRKPTYEELEARVRELEDKERYFRLIADNATDMISKHDPDGRYTYVSSACFELLGYTPEELIGKSAYDFFHPDDVAAIVASHTEIRRSPVTFSIPYRIRRKDGRYAWVETTSKTVRDPDTGRIEEIVSATRDITQRKTAEKELRELNETMDLAQKMAGIGYWRYDKKTEKRMWSSQMYENFGLDPDMGPPSLAEIRKVFHPDDRDAYVANFQIAMAGVPYDQVAKIRFPDGSIHFVHTRGYPRTDEDGNIAGTFGTSQDITERILAERALRKSEEKYRRIFENSVVGFFESTPEGRFIRVNSAFARMLGYASPEALVSDITDIGRQYYVTPEDRLRYKQILQKNGKIDGFEFRARCRDGAEIWVSNSTRAYFDEKGRVIRYEGVVNDITQRKLAEEALRQSEERFRLAFRTSPDSININRASDGLYLDINEGFANVMGYSREEVVGKTSLELNIWKDPADRERLVKSLKRKGYVENLAAEFVDKDGGVHSGLMSARLLELDGEEVILSITRDITQWLRVQAELQQSEERYRSLVENTLDGFFVCEIPSMKFVFLNQRICDLFGFDMQEALPLKIWDVIDPAEHRLVEERIRARIEGRQPQYTSNIYTVRRKDGARFKAEVSTSLTTYSGKPVVQGILRDVTEKHRLQMQLQQAQKFEAIGTLAGGIAHDFNNLLMGIQGRASLMSLELGPSHPQREHLDAVEEHVRSATHLTRQLLGFARGGKYEVKPVDANELLAESADMFGRTRKEIRIHMKTNPAPLVVDADRRQIEQVLLNLFVNAWQAMPDGGELYLETRAVVLEEADCIPYEAQSGRYAKISVTDTGVGMSEAVRQQIFDPFFTTKDKSRGTGLGLASAYGIVKNHGGIISVYSEVGQGTTFNVYLPISDREVTPEESGEQAPFRGTETILLVDDEKMVIDVGRALLEKLGYRVMTADRGEQAVETVRTAGEQIDLVILDMVMPGMDGGRVFDRIREIRPGMPVLLSSGYSINGQAQDIMSRGCNGFIQKPFSLSELSLKVRQILEGSDAAV